MATLLMVGCGREIIPDEELSNKDRMNKLQISDPLVWNSLVDQSIKIDTSGLGLKGANGTMKIFEYPGDGKYYYTIFEDLYPSQGDYDFNDLMLESRLFLEPRKNEISGRLNATMFHRGGTLKTQISLAFYSNNGKKGYEIIPNEQIRINDVDLTGQEPYAMDVPKAGANFDINFILSKGEVPIDNIWVSWFIQVESGGEVREIHTAGFPLYKVNKFEIPQRDYLTQNNLPWGLEIMAERFYVPLEKTLFLDAFPEFKVWAESGGDENTEWFKNPDLKYIN